MSRDRGKTRAASDYPSAPFASQRPTKPDEVGDIMVTITRRDGAKYIRGSLSRAFTVKASRVSKVADVIEVALFGKNR